MRIGRFTHFFSLCLLLLAGTLTLALWQGARQLAAEQQALFTLQVLQQRLGQQLPTRLQEYLGNGNNESLQQAIRLLDAAISQLPQTQPELGETLGTLRQRMKSDYLAAGKLSGTPALLLQHAEQEMAGQIRQLLAYAGRPVDPALEPARLAYQIQAQALATTLIELIHQRESYQGQGETGNKKALEQTLALMQGQYRQLATLPLLGHLEEKEEPLLPLLTPAPPAELGEQARDELASLLRRYPKELDETTRQLARQQQARQQIRQDVASLYALLDTLVKSQQTERQQGLSQLGSTIASMAAALVLFTLLGWGFQYRWVLRPLRRLQRAFAALAQTGQAEPLPAMGQGNELAEIGESYNQLIVQWQRSSQTKASQLDAVSRHLNEMVTHVEQICHSTRSAASVVRESGDMMRELDLLAAEVRQVADEIAHHAHHNEHTMRESESVVQAMLEASRKTTGAIDESRSAIKGVTLSLNEVEAMVEVIGHIAQQTNLLALNAAIEAARAGKQGEGFAVVADEVRHLSTDTQRSLQQIVGVLGRLQEAGGRLSASMEQIEQHARAQQSQAGTLFGVTRAMQESARSTASIACQGAGNARSQSEYLTRFAALMEQLHQQSARVTEEATRVASHMGEQACRIPAILRQ
ncbi:methyl-accepting chemotaxis protein [Aeromonas diversa CDC 2478-85]|uniref:Methyl-accepting chemotaxis protein n=1 Tax=Aeromonas diversa CDC 2478-85 TaxID=1268237 RepID=N9U2A8_9GAMM|nr:methyl-accepting chemotaxis protein [Aeromonas diversa]ENY72509.1 methyl-accepting chemotaxis protein [Aeromonas diversa CDC 2478-85]